MPQFTLKLWEELGPIELNGYVADNVFEVGDWSAEHKNDRLREIISAETLAFLKANPVASDENQKALTQQLAAALEREGN